MSRNRGERTILNSSPFKNELKSTDDRLKAKRVRKSLPFEKGVETKYAKRQKVIFSNSFIDYKEEVEEEETYYGNFYDVYYYFYEKCLYSKI